MRPPRSVVTSRAGFVRSAFGWARRVGMALLLAAATPSLADEAPAASFLDSVYMEYSAGFDYSRGDYGLDRDSSLYYVPLGLTADYAYWRLRLLVPVLYSDGVTGTQTFGGPPPPGSDPLESDHNAGLGDIVTTVSYLFAPAIPPMPWIELSGQISWPTRTASNLGTGNFGFSTQIDVFKKVGRITPFARAGRNYYVADSLGDRFYASVGASILVVGKTSVGVAYDWLGSTNKDIEDGHEIVPFLSFAASKRWSIGPYAVVGLSDGSPNYGAGFSVRFRP